MENNEVSLVSLGSLFPTVPFSEMLENNQTASPHPSSLEEEVWGREYSHINILSAPIFFDGYIFNIKRLVYCSINRNQFLPTAIKQPLNQCFRISLWLNTKLLAPWVPPSVKVLEWSVFGIKDIRMLVKDNKVEQLMIQCEKMMSERRCKKKKSIQSFKAWRVHECQHSLLIPGY